MNLKKILKETFKEKSFEEWAAERKISLPDKKTSTRPWLFAKPARWIATAAASIILVLAIVLPFALRDAEPSANGSPIIYSAYDSISQTVKLDDLLLLENVLLFPNEQVISYEGIFRHVVKESTDIILSYAIRQMLFLLSDDENAFVIDYKIRVYRHYHFFDYPSFQDLEQYFMMDNVQVLYRISEIEKEFGALSEYTHRAHIHFIYSGKEYFITVNSFENITKINSCNIRLLMNELFL